MRDLRTLLLALALMLFAACVTQKNSRPAAASTPAKTQVSHTAGKSTAPLHGQVPGASAKNMGLPAAEIGYYMDVLQGRLQQQLDPAVVIARENDSIVLDFSRRVGFIPDTAQLDDASRALLAPLEKILGEYRAALVLVRVSAEENDAAARRLAQLRAATIERTLINAGLASARVVTGAAIAAARDGEAHVEIVLVPETRGD